jgi:S1/P1 Nuclease
MSDSGQESILTAFPMNINVLQCNTSISERAIAFCWFEHLAGDVHQPLYTTKLITVHYPEPKGDRGCTRFYIRARPNSSTISLHKFWDDLILGSERFRSVRNKATELRSRSILQRATHRMDDPISMERNSGSKTLALGISPKQTSPLKTLN